MNTAFAAARARVPMIVLHAGLEALDRHAVERAMLQANLKISQKEIEELLLDVMEESAREMIPTLHRFRASKSPKNVIEFRFDRTNPSAVAWAKNHAGELIKGISKTTRDDVREVITRAFVEGIPPRSAASLLLDAVGDATRALTIARTETMRASNEGQEQLWKQATDVGLLTGREERMWIVTPDDRLCPICEGLEDRTSPLNGMFTSNSGASYDVPPAHPNCRCVMGLK